MIKYIKSDKSNDRRPDWYGIPGLKFIDHGSWADAEIEYKGLLFNTVDLEETYFYWFHADYPKYSDELFESFMLEQGDNIKYELAENIYTPTGVADWVVSKLDFETDFIGAYTLDDVDESIQYLKDNSIVPKALLDKIKQHFVDVVGGAEPYTEDYSELMNTASSEAMHILVTEVTNPKYYGA